MFLSIWFCATHYFCRRPRLENAHDYVPYARTIQSCTIPTVIFDLQFTRSIPRAVRFGKKNSSLRARAEEGIKEKIHHAEDIEARYVVSVRCLAGGYVQLRGYSAGYRNTCRRSK